ncbi:Cobalt-zinc-cadmium resistance protein CzcI precursor [Pigmentiphaga humi]|uniref:Cobalt-zinc-cadmium resistance protein CzcI n=2 Tax=Pigmentiphaga humi TaxID=2478468 RepID=A0A3P4B1V3_9BURK|nr:Cobalt-zinc-cadmium resistance protein CzcI precursor [Pigmentiphaga humi]
MPFQAAWAAAASYCEHESGVTVQRHFGHHDHAHEPDAGAGGALSGHPDCAVCHAVALKAVVGGLPELAPQPVVRHHVSAPPPFLAPAPVFPPERPQWAASV